MVVSSQKENLDKRDYCKHWDNILKKEFSKETDRGAVILTAALLDNSLQTLLGRFLVPVDSASDELFEANGPTSTFSHRINLAYRLGLISPRLCKDLHITRRIRNDFAHSILDCTFENESVKSRIAQLERSFSGALISEIRKKHFPSGTRGNFLMICSLSLFVLNAKISSINHISEEKKEWIYSYK